MTAPVVIPAATLVLLRAPPDGVDATVPERLMPDVLMIERGGGMAFAAGAMVFPGGRVDPGDRAFAAILSPAADPIETAARVAAIRETIEEVGIAAGIVPAPDEAAIGRVRAGLAGGAEFAALLAGEGLSLDLAALTLFARWRPDLHPTRNFDTLFFFAEAPAMAVARPDGGESVRAVWGTARTLLTEADAGRHHVIFPTRRNLERLAGLESIAAAITHAAAYPATAITPWLEDRGGESWLCIPEGAGYPVTAELASKALRG